MTVLSLKEQIYVISQALSVNDMQLSCADVTLVNSKKLREYPMIEDGSVIVQSKTSLELVPGLILSYDKDIFIMSDGN